MSSPLHYSLYFMFVKFHIKKLRDRDDGDGGGGKSGKGQREIERKREKEREWSRELEGLGTALCSSSLAVCP